MQFIILIFVIVACFILYKMFKGLSRTKKTKPKALKIENVDVGGVIHLRNIGSNLDEFDLTIIAKHLYRQGNYYWTELECDNGKDKVWLELENDDDELEVSITLKKIKLTDLNLTNKKLVKIENDDDGEIIYNNRKYYYEDSGKAEFLKHADKNSPEVYYFWDFEADDEKHFISIEKWTDNAYDVSTSEAIKLSQIEVFSLNNEE
ncbi:MAG: DUF4178 domain-containing protein [bacterium]|nr:DUF4178 domain-containing protein [bacterium]